MRIERRHGHYHYMGDHIEQLDHMKCGAWMFSFDQVSSAVRLCEEAIRSGVAPYASHRDAVSGFGSFYINGDDIEAHKRVIRFFVEHDLFRKDFNGNLYNTLFQFNRSSDGRLNPYGPCGTWGPIGPDGEYESGGPCGQCRPHSSGDPGRPPFDHSLELDSFINLKTGKWKRQRSKYPGKLLAKLPWVSTGGTI